MDKQTMIPFSAGEKLLAPRTFTTLVKPVGARCNLRCKYCYYLPTAELYDGHESRMSLALLEEYIRQYIDAVEAPVATFCWHGGEPLLAGIDFYRKAMELQERYRGDKTIENTLQTNGTLVDEAWCDFFRQHRFLVGLSLDGPQALHDAHRLDAAGEPTHGRVARAALLMASRGVEFNILCAVNAVSVRQPLIVYRYLRRLCPYIQFLPVCDGGDPASIGGEEWGRFLCAVYDEWVAHDVGRVFVQLFDVTLQQWCGMRATLCAFCETCGDGLAVEHNGDVYCCDHFVDGGHRLGNLLQTPLAELARDARQTAFGTDKFSTLPRQCRRCEWLFLCHGECPEHRHAVSDDGEGSMNALCAGYRRFFAHTADDMRLMRSLLERQLPPAEIMRTKKTR